MVLVTDYPRTFSEKDLLSVREHGELATQTDRDYDRFRVVPARSFSRLLLSAAAVAFLALIAWSVLSNPRWGWPVFADYFFSEPILVGLGRTLLLTVLGTVLGFALGTVLALARVSGPPLVSGLSWLYSWLLRSVPVIVLLLVLNNLGYLYDTLHIANPLTGTVYLDYPMTQVLTPFTSAIIGLTLNQAAFSAENIRGGILSVDQGQSEAAAALGLSRGRQAFRIILPQAMRSILPNGFNEVIGLAKSTSMVYILALPDLFYTVQVIYRRNLEVIPLLMVATVWYLLIMTALSAVQFFIERRFARGAVRTLPPLPLAGLFRRIFPQAAQPRQAEAARSQSRPVKGLQGAPIIQRAGGDVRIHGISKSFGVLKVLDGIDLHLPKGSVTAILGPSGSGKSTLLRTINHLERVDEGFISIDDELVGYRREGRTLYELKERDILRRRAEIGMVFQNFNLFPHMTALENIIEAPISVLGLPREVAVSEARDLLDRIGLSDKEQAYPRQLSGGQQQRVAIARALALKPKVLLFDEPTSALDPELVGEVLDVIKELAGTGTTLVIVTHEAGFAREVADTVVFMERGSIIETGSPEHIFSNAAHPRTREFLARVR